MSGLPLVQCVVCRHVGYPKKNGIPRNHPAPGEGPANARPTCPGSQQPGTPVERTR